jgi:predicted HTH domain antitoxin
MAAAVKWYELGMISQAKAAGIAGITRSEFITELARFKVTPFQYGPVEISQEVEG